MTTHMLAKWTTVSGLRLAGVTAMVAGVIMFAGACQPTQIRGTVVSSTDAMPIAGQIVTVYANDSESVVASTSTDQNGTYRFTDLAAGTYRIAVDDHWFADATSWSTATPIDVAGSTTIADFAVPVDTARIIGSVSNGYSGLAGWDVYALSGPGTKLVGRSTTDQNGRFELHGLAGGTYRLAVIDPTAAGRLEWWGTTGTTAADRAASPTFTVTAGATIDVADNTVAAATCDPAIYFPGANLDGADLTDAELWGCDLHLVNLRGVDLDGANLTGANLTATNITATNGFSGTNLSGANLTGTSLAATDLRTTTLIGANLTDVDLMFANLSGTSLAGTNLTGAKLTVTGSSFVAVRSGGIVGTPSALPDYYQLIGGFLVGPQADLANSDLSGLDLSNTNLVGANLTGTDLTGANLYGVRAVGVIGTPATLPGTYRLYGTTILGPGVHLRPLPCAVCTAPDLRAMDLTGVDLTDVDLSGLPLTGTNLTNANLTNAQLGLADMSGLVVTGAIMEKTKLVFFDVNQITGLRSGGITGTPEPNPVLKLEHGYLLGPNVDLSGVDLTGFDLDGLNLSGANLTATKSSGITGTPGILPVGWTLRAGRLFGPGVDLSDADLTGADLTGLYLMDANLTGAVLIGADLTGTILVQVNLTDTNLSGANLSGVTSGGIIGAPAAVPAGWYFASGCLFGPGAGLTGDLTGVDLSGLDLTGARFSNADLTGADLTGTNLSGAVFWFSHLTGADLTGANLSGATLSVVDVAGTDFTDADFTGLVSDGLTGSPTALPAGYELVDGAIVATP